MVAIFHGSGLQVGDRVRGKERGRPGAAGRSPGGSGGGGRSPGPAGEQGLDELARVEVAQVVELFADFYRLQNNDQPPSAAHMKEIEKTLRELEERP